MAILHWCILGLGTLALLARSIDPRRFVLVVIFTLPFNGVFVEIGQRLELFKIASLIALPVAACHLPRMLAAGGGCGGLGMFAAWSAWITLLTLGFPPEYMANDGDGMRSLGLRTCLQGTLLLARLTLAGLCILALARSRDVVAGIRAWVAATTVLAGFGLLEQACHFVGLEIGGVYYDGLLSGGPTHLRQAVFGLDFKRIGSFAHEPKMLARWLVPSIMILLCDAASGNRLAGRASWTRMLVAIHCVALVFTFSTSGYMIAAASLAVPLLAMGGLGMASARYLATVGSLAIGAGVWGLGFGALFDAVIAEKSAKYGGFVQGGTDGVGIAFLEAYPGTAIWGSGVGTQGFYLPEFIAGSYDFVYDNVAERGFGGFGVESGWLSLLLDTGCVGIALLLLPVVARWQRGPALLQRFARRPDGADDVAAILLSRCMLGSCLIGMAAYPLEAAGLLAVSMGLASAAVAAASRNTMTTAARAPVRAAVPLPRPFPSGGCA